MTDLREKLAARLKEVAKAPLREAGTNALGAIAAHYDALADECIRQMEWARAKRLVPSDGTMPPLTVAPDDWKPQQEETP